MKRHFFSEDIVEEGGGQLPPDYDYELNRLKINGNCLQICNPFAPSAYCYSISLEIDSLNGLELDQACTCTVYSLHLNFGLISLVFSFNQLTACSVGCLCCFPTEVTNQRVTLLTEFRIKQNTNDAASFEMQMALAIKTLLRLRSTELSNALICKK